MIDPAGKERASLADQHGSSDNWSQSGMTFDNHPLISFHLQGVFGLYTYSNYKYFPESSLITNAGRHGHHHLLTSRLTSPEAGGKTHSRASGPQAPRAFDTRPSLGGVWRASRRPGQAPTFHLRLAAILPSLSAHIAPTACPPAALRRRELSCSSSS